MMKIFNSILLILFLNSFLLPDLLAQTTRYAGTYNELSTAINASANSGDIIQISADIVVTDQLTISKSLTIYGNGYTITVPNPGLDEMGRFNSVASTFRVFNFSAGTNTLNNLTIKGGNVTSAGGAIYISSSTNLTLNNCIISNSRTTGWVGGGAIHNQGVLFMNGCYIRRNAAEYGGGLLNNGSSARAYFESSTLVENRVTSASGGGGAVENKGGAFMYFNNSTLSNNQSLIVGGAVNNYQSTLYFINSSATGNVVYGVDQGSSVCKGGSISNNGGTFYSVNSLYAHNYRATTGSTANPGGFILDDITPYSSPGQVHIYYSIYHANLPTGLGTNNSNIQYTGYANGTDNSIFSDGIASRLTDDNGTEIGDPIYRPFLYNNEGSVAPTLQNSSFVLQAANRGTRTRYANNNNVNPVVAYYNGSAYVNLTGISASGQEVLLDQVGDARPDPPARGAIEGVVSDLYMVKVLVSGSGTVNGGTFYGDVYPAGTSVTLTAIPNSGYEFTRYDYVLGGSGTASIANPYTFTVNSDITLQPVFTALPANNYSVTYLGNGNTGGTAPVDVTFSGSTTIAAPGTLVKTGYTFSGWNTNANGSGTSYAAGATYSTAANLVLYAKWTLDLVWNWTGASSTAWGTIGNWSRSDLATPSVPAVSDNVVISDKDNDPVIASAVGANCNNLTLNSGAILTIQSGGSLITNGSITNNGTIEIKRDISQSAWHLTSIPVTTSTANSYLGDYLQSWSEASHVWTDITDPATTLQPLQGYGLWATPSKAAASYTFTGTPNTGNMSKSLSFTEYSTNSSAYEGANLLGNPYPSAIDWSLLDNTYGAVNYWNGATNSYSSWNNGAAINGGVQYIPPMQGFFIIAPANGTFSINNSHRTHTGATSYFKNNEISENSIRLVASSQIYTDELLVRFTDEATTGFDLQHDAYKFASGTAGLSELYSYTGNKKLSIDVRPVCDVVQLGFANDQSGTYSIGINQVNGITKATLEDTKTNTFTDLLKGTYAFSYTAGESDQRFKLHMSTLGIDDKKATEVVIYSYRKTAYINLASQVKGDIYIFNISGQLVASLPAASGMNEIQLPVTGNYIVKVVTGSSAEVKKIFIQ
jgi:uncharacterized repeat protein (TIGR02543 family)